MPDLNLIDEGGFEESPIPAAPPAKKKTSSGGGGGGLKLIIILFIVIVLGAGLYMLNKRGIVKLWGKKTPPVAQVQEEPFPPEQNEQAAQEAAKQAPKQADTNEVALLEPAPVEENAEAPKEKKKEEVTETETAAKLSDMKGEFTVQVVAYREKKEAVDMAKRLEFSGYPAFVEKYPVKGGSLFTVRIGRYVSREEALKAVKTFAPQLQAHYIIDKVREK